MAIEKHKFEEFFYKPMKKLVSLKELLQYYKENNNVNKYEQGMFCPECKKALLTFISSKHPYLRKLPNSNHIIDCSYNQPVASNKMIKDYYENLDDKTVQAKLATLEKYFFEDSPDKRLKDNKGFKVERVDTQNDSVNVKRQERHYHVLKKRKLDNYIDFKSNDLFDLYAFYGQVKVYIKNATSKGGYKYHYLILDTDDEYHHAYYIYRGQTKESIKDKSWYKVVLIGNYEKNKKGYIFDMENPYHNGHKMYQIELVNGNQDAIAFKEVNQK